MKFTVLILVGLLVTIVTIGLVALRRDQAGSEETILLHRVEISDFVAFVTEPGDVASSTNVEVRCRVKSRGAAGTAILKICDEGTQVKAGDFLVQFDDSALQNELLSQKIVVANDKALLIQAQSDLANAKRTLQEFEEGLYQQELELMEAEGFIAEEELRKRVLDLASSKRLASRGLITELQVSAAEFAVAKTSKDVAAATRKVDVYKRFTREKLIGEYKSEIAKQEANLEAATFTHALSEQKRAEIEEQISHCLIVAPNDGQVVHANERNGRGDNPEVMEEGTIVRENQVVIRLPDLDDMQVDVKINESHVNHISAGQPVEIELDANPDSLLRGEVLEVAPYPFPIRWHGAPMEYGAVVKILDPPPSIRPGLRAKVRIIFESKSHVLQVPLAAVIEHGDRHYCLVRDQQAWLPQAIKIGSTNNMHVIVEEGLAVDDRVALTPFRYIKRSDLPDSEPIGVAADKTSRGRQARPISSNTAAATSPAS